MRFLKYCFGLESNAQVDQDESLFEKMKAIDTTELYYIKEDGIFKSIGYILIENKDNQSGKFVDLNEKGAPIFKQVSYNEVYNKKKPKPMERI